MCGRAGMTVGAAAVGGRVRAAGCAVDDAVPEPYATGTTKNAKDRDAYPTVVASDAGLTLRTKSFGVRRLRCHCVFDGWMGKTTWRAAAMAPKGRCAVVVTSFVEGVTCRRADDGIFFVLGFAIGDDEFVILTTDAKQTSLLGERARKSEGFGSGRMPLVVDGAGAAAWVAPETAAAPEAVARGLDEAARSNALGLVTGASRAKKAAAPGRTLHDFWGGGAKKKAKVEPTSAATPPTSVKAEAVKEPEVVDLCASDDEPAPAARPPPPTIKEMKASISAAGLPTADLVERPQVEERYKEAVARLAEAARLKREA
mmetsp:Transcript_29790/g.92163  ORF Transcript_29790/g.92163 Transcript_29790/m.92163 type:complete len:314 (+) Transcript_29790:905-1846(+)